jgi:hypothetical protein
MMYTLLALCLLAVAQQATAFSLSAGSRFVSRASCRSALSMAAEEIDPNFEAHRKYVYVYVCICMYMYVYVCICVSALSMSAEEDIDPNFEAHRKR